VSGTVEAPNVLLVVLDSVRARNTSLLGHERETTPFLAEFAERSTTYVRGYAPSTESLASHASLFTGLPVRAHGLTTSTGVTESTSSDGERSRLRPERTVWRELSEAGYATAVFSSNPFLTGLPTGLPASFDTIVDRRRELPFPGALDPRSREGGAHAGEYAAFLRDAVADATPFRSLANGAAFKFGSRLPGALSIDPSARTYVDAFRDWQADRSGPWAACLNLMDAHQQYQPGPTPRWTDAELLDRLAELDDPVWEYVGGHRPLSELRSFERVYDDAIRSMDAQLRRIVEILADRGELDRSLVVVTADHGEGFGERSAVRPERRIVGHSSGGIHDVLAHVPLVVKRPEQREGRIVDEPTTLTGFADAVRAAAGIGDIDPGADDPFSPDERVLVSTDGINTHMTDLAAPYTDPEEIEIRSTPADAVYEQVNGGVAKHVTWGDRSATVRVDDPGRPVERGPMAGRRVSDALERVSLADVLDRRGAAVSSDVTARLEELGYM